MRHVFRLLVVAFVVGAAFAAGWVQAQGRATPPTQSIPIPPPTVVRGNDLGFRIDGHNGERTTGRIVIWNGARWVETAFTVAPRNLTRGQ